MEKKHKFLIYGLLSFTLLLIMIFILYLYRMSKPEQTISRGKITAILNNENNLFWKDTWEGLRKEAEDRNFELAEYQVTSGDSIADYLEIAVLTETNGIIFNPSMVRDPQSEEFLREAHEKGIPLISVDSDYKNVPSLSIKLDNISSSQKIADYILQNIKGEKIILLTYDVNYSSPLHTRLDTIRRSLTDHGYEDNIILLKIPNDEVEIREYLNTYLSDFQENAFLIGTGPQQTLYTARTIFSLGLTEQFHLIGFGESQEAIDLLKKGAIEALLIQNNRQMGSLSVKYMEEALSGSSLPDSSVFVDSSLYTDSNIDTLTQEH
ncbi:MAG: substrate-binding domain-containing protein [Eubacteriales bacterium]|nr:substrate-binding domain-containing protein [Eubacteriales bacterium]